MFAVVGATGQTGAGVVRQLVAEGRAVRAIVRDHAAARKLLPAAAEVIAVDHTDRAALGAALDGVERMYVGLGRSLELVALEQHVVDAARAAGVRQYVKCSGVTVSRDAGSQIQRIHAELEDYVRANVPYTIVAPSFFMQNFLGLAGAIAHGVLPLPTGAARAGLIDAADIVRSAVAAFDDRHLGRRYQLTGPASLSHADAAASFARVLGHDVQFADVTEADFVAGCIGAGLPDWFAAMLADVYVRFFATGAADLVTDDVRALTGIAPRSLDAWIRDHAAAFAVS